MEIRNWLVTCLLLVAAPAWIGGIWCYFAGTAGNIKNLLLSWVSGFLTVMAVSQIILVPLVLRRHGFTEYRYSVMVLYAVLMLAALFLNLKRWKNAREKKAKEKEKTKERTKEPWNMWQILFLAGALGLILIQAFVVSFFQHIDDDDSRFVVEQVLAVEHGAMYTENPVTGKISYWVMGEVR